MTPSDDPRDDMKRFPTADDADGLLGGRRSPDDLPDEAAPLATLFSSLRSYEPAARDAEADRRAIAAMVAGIRSRSLQVASGTPHSIVRRVPVKAAALAFAAVLVSGTAAAAVNGSLPGPVQRAVASTLSHVSISVPNPDDHSNNTNRGNGANNHAPGQTAPGRGNAAPSGPVGPDADGSAKYGLCTAAGQNSSSDDAVAFSNLQKAASEAGMTVAEFCAGVTRPTGSTGPGTTHPTGPSGSTGPSGGTGPSGPTGGPTGPTGPDESTTTTTVHGPPTSHPGQGHTPTTKPPKPKGPTGPPTSHSGGINSGSAHLSDQGAAGS